MIYMGVRVRVCDSKFRKREICGKIQRIVNDELARRVMNGIGQSARPENSWAKKRAKEYVRRRVDVCVFYNLFVCV